MSRYYVVTGAAGFIGSNLVAGLNARGITKIIAVDNMTKGDKFRNLVDCEIADYMDKHDFRNALLNGVAQLPRGGSQIAERTSGR